MYIFFSMNEGINGRMEENPSVEKWKPRLESESLRAESDLRNDLMHSFSFTARQTGSQGVEETDPMRDYKSARSRRSGLG